MKQVSFKFQKANNGIIVEVDVVGKPRETYVFANLQECLKFLEEQIEHKWYGAEPKVDVKRIGVPLPPPPGEPEED